LREKEDAYEREEEEEEDGEEDMTNLSGRMISNTPE